MGFLGTLLILSVVEFWIPRHALLENETAVPWVVKGSIVSRVKSSGGVFCFGDSLMQYGVYPRVIEETTGRRGYNFAVPAGSPETSYYFLKRLLAAGARPEVVLVDFMPYQTYVKPNLEANRLRLWPECANLGEIFDFLSVRKNPDYVVSLLLGKYLASYRLRGEIRECIASALDGDSRAHEAYCAELTRHNLEANLGAIALPEGLRGAIDLQQVVWPDYVGVPDLQKLAYIDRFIRLANAHQIKVVWVVPPISPEFQRGSEYMGVDANFSKLLDLKLLQFPQLEVVDFRRCGYPATHFHDPLHLNRKGGALLSRALGERIIGDAPASRWVQVTGGREAAASAQVEDLYGTHARVGLSAPETRRR